jgi:hypothetical protein
MRTQFLSATKRLFPLLAVWMNVLPGVQAQAPGEAAYWYLGDWPGKTTPGWNQDTQGLAHDQDNWFITQEMKIWKIPVTHDLNSNAENMGFTTVSMQDTPLFAEHYNHFGDPECFDSDQFGGPTFLVVPVEGGPQRVIALFRADSLTYHTHTNLPNQLNASWCAFDSQGNLYSSDFDFNNKPSIPIFKYTVDWPRVIASGELCLSLTNVIQLRDEDGNNLSVQWIQGGVITPSGALLYLMAGYWNDFNLTNGIHAFDLSSGYRVKRSERQSGSFRFDWSPGLLTGEEPEGLTFWDLDDGRAPNISGQLHVLLLDNDKPDDDDILVKHYTSTLHVDRSYNGDEKGSLRQPFNTVNEANNLIWDGAQITIASGLYPEALTFSKRIAVVPSGGPVTIGQ